MIWGITLHQYFFLETSFEITENKLNPKKRNPSFTHQHNCLQIGKYWRFKMVRMVRFVKAA